MESQGHFVDGLSPPEKSNTIEVVVLGLSRTGTMSMYNALNTLGYTTYHMSEACKMTPKDHLKMWNEALQAKYGSSLPPPQPPSLSPQYSPLDFQKLLQNYTAVTDAPTVLFIPELLSAYPHARLILTTHPRGTEAWLRSMRNSYFRVAGWKIWSLLMKHDDRFSLPYMTLIRRIVEVWSGEPWLEAEKGFEADGGDGTVEKRLRDFYEGHNNEMRRLARVQGRKMLEFRPEMGWGPLCEFLGKEVPSGPYPHYNEGDYVVNLHKAVVFMRLKAVFGARVLMAVIATVGAGLAWWWFKE